MGDYADDATSRMLDMLEYMELEYDDDPEDEYRVAPGRPMCPYCGKEAKLVTGKHVYPHRPDLADLTFWRCDPCDAHVGTTRSGNARGPLANARLRQLRLEAHAAFDPYWKGGAMSRTKAYEWLARQLGVTEREAHIGSSNEEFCKRVIELCTRRPRGAR